MSIRLVTVPLTIEEKKTTKKVEIYNPSGGFRALENAITILIHWTNRVLDLSALVQLDSVAWPKYQERLTKTRIQ